MKITKRQLRKIIREEKQKLLSERNRDYRGSASPAAALRQHAPELVGRLYAVINEIDNFISMEHAAADFGPGSDRDNTADAIKTIVDEWLAGIRG